MRLLRVFFVVFTLSFFINIPTARAGPKNPVSRGFFVASTGIVFVGLETYSTFMAGLAIGRGGWEGLGVGSVLAPMGGAIIASAGTMAIAELVGSNTKIVFQNTVIVSSVVIILNISYLFGGDSNVAALRDLTLVALPFVAGITAAREPKIKSVPVLPVFGQYYSSCAC